PRIQSRRHLPLNLQKQDHAKIDSYTTSVDVTDHTGRGPGKRGRGPAQAGQRVEVITPDTDSRAAMGTNQMDLATRIPAARAGFAQGKQEAARVTFL
ncbi:hypothetical protein ABZV22_45290, partial [Streptosporangium canum]